MTAAGDTANPPHGDPAARHGAVPRYELRVEGHLGSGWSAWFDGLTVTAAADGTTALCGPVVDQAALHGLLQRLRDLGLPLVSLALVPPDAPAGPPARVTDEGN